MNTKSLCRMLGSGAPILLALALFPGEAHAQQQGYGYPQSQGYGPEAPAYSQQQQPYASPQYQGGQSGYAYPPPPSYAPPPGRTEYVSPIEFLPTFGKRFGQMFRRIFYGDGPPPGYEALPGYQGNQPDYSLDNPPAYGSHYGQPPGINIPPRYEAQPRYEAPPAPAPERRPMAQPQQQPQPEAVPRTPMPPRTPTVTEKKKSSVAPSSTPKKYTPPSITRNPPARARVESQAPESKSVAPREKESERERVKPGDSPPAVNDNIYPLPGSKPAPEKDSPPAPKNNNSSANAGSGKAGTTGGGSGGFLKGKRTNKEGRVVSPYPPYQELDVTGLSSGSLALDPTTQKVFEVP